MQISHYLLILSVISMFLGPFATFWVRETEAFLMHLLLVLAYKFANSFIAVLAKYKTIF
ncbi:hypothetical protein BGW36DRAFT_384499 [Talaromyces proteolyticus]|uniref:Uncharacterized protein n=1 Tax=Talaromyces proteolyticus TaxID=1131652 RepID=A0AAD4KLW3_9EURO|nr:uncharacterized protein BGW36DRAFT_384499 [Talaromyces proteolyticus]KAH8694174.1 hypothetical protein BGW36DRAFT_384499 [Talaromyces proteolyticus]